ncbi:hypothetical protein RINTHM_8470 [Richelia intracellularis HM01]|nr:hypothetical protein RINTHM_8470 [Richelia intracellularis HM01]
MIRTGTGVLTSEGIEREGLIFTGSKPDFVPLDSGLTDNAGREDFCAGVTEISS